MSKIRRSHCPEQKVNILKEHLVERRDISAVCNDYGIHPNMFYKWQKQFFENGERAFQNQKDTQTKLLVSKAAKSGPR